MTRRFTVLTMINMIIALGLAINVSGQNSLQIPSEQDYYDFFNSLTNPDSVKTFNLSSSPEVDEILDEIPAIFEDSIFTPQDTAFIRQQIISAINFKWTEGKMLGARIIDGKEIAEFFESSLGGGWREFHKKYGDGFKTYSIPLFSVDRTKCVISYRWHCGGLCGHGGAGLFSKKNGKWKQEKSYMYYVN